METMEQINSVLNGGRVLYLYSGTDKKSMQKAFLTGQENMIFITDDKIDSAGPKVKIINSRQVNGFKFERKTKILLDGDCDSSLKIEKKLSALRNCSIICAYNMTKTSQKIIKELVQSHNKMILAANNLTVLSSDNLNEINFDDESVEKFVKNDLETLVLALLLREPMCGTGIIKRVQRKFGVLLSPGTVYPLLHSLEKKGLLKCDYGIKTKEYKLSAEAEQEIREKLEKHVQVSRLLSNFIELADKEVV